mmetsp:Transcript_3107/g.11899  ORF Transcript_3107/g.11899 Transcript_3107/m.11899 type:complete len:209 (-) Transcript_3107:2392-3018(-)
MTRAHSFSHFQMEMRSYMHCAEKHRILSHLEKSTRRSQPSFLRHSLLWWRIGFHRHNDSTWTSILRTLGHQTTLKVCHTLTFRLWRKRRTNSPLKPSNRAPSRVALCSRIKPQESFCFTFVHLRWRVPRSLKPFNSRHRCDKGLPNLLPWRTHSMRKPHSQCHVNHQMYRFPKRYFCSRRHHLVWTFRSFHSLPPQDNLKRWISPCNQ